MDILPEPLYKWTNLDGNDLLKLIYTNPKRWGLTQVRNNIGITKYHNPVKIVKPYKMYKLCIRKYPSIKTRNPTAD